MYLPIMQESQVMDLLQPVAWKAGLLMPCVKKVGQSDIPSTFSSKSWILKMEQTSLMAFRL